MLEASILSNAVARLRMEITWREDQAEACCAGGRGWRLGLRADGCKAVQGRVKWKDLSSDATWHTCMPNQMHAGRKLK